MDKDNLKDESVYIYTKGKLERIDPPKTGHGKLYVNWADSKITHHEFSYTKK